MKKLLLAFCLIAGAAVAQTPAEIWGGLYNLVRPTLATRQQAVFQMSSTSSLRLAVAAFDPDAQTLINAMVPTPQLGRQLLINRTIVALKAGGVWPLLDALYLTAAASEQAARLNWVNPATFGLVASGSVAFQVDRGFTGNGVNSYNNTQFNPATAPGAKYTSPNAHLSIWSNTAAASTAVDIGNASAFIIANIAGNFRTQINGAPQTIDPTPTGAGMFMGVRSSDSTASSYRNGVVANFAVTPPAAQSANAVALGGRPFGTQSFSSRQLAAGSIGAALTNAQALAFYNALAGYMAGVQMGYDPDAKAIIAAMVPPPPVGRQDLINSTVLALKAAGIWDQLDLLYFMAAHSQQAGYLNWKNPSAFPLTVTGAVSFTVDQGCQGDGATGYLSTGWVPNTNGVNFTQDSASLWMWSNTAAASNFADAGSGGTPGSYILARTVAGNLLTGRMNDGSIGGGATTGGVGFYGNQRIDASTRKFWLSGVQAGTTLTVASTGRSIAASGVCGVPATNFSIRQQSMFATGASLAGKEAQLYSITRAYMSGVGLPMAVGDFP